ncbi:carbohydrate esterase family 4 protein [Roridomyces roridus]|uniref:chitin deacetylase n=1 Tax=Roridomyces roridus TaxID=1738132 RepID=A0AAD7BAI9_9AGAR|nr:carbohydrate esterase family 4 protein [Roridomyces roridus]
MHLPTSLFLLGLTAAAVRGQVTRTSEKDEAAIHDPDTECQPYVYPPVEKLKSSFPAIWEYASKILPNDSAAQAKYASFKDSIPNIAPKGTLSGDITGVKYDSNADPDCWWTGSLCVTPKLAGLKPDIADVPEPKTIGYGFDDGPHCGHNVFYDYLSSKNQTATMFYIGSNVLSLPLEAQRAVADGHEICVHTWSHNAMTATSDEGAFAELWYSIQAVKLVTGYTPTCWRPPFGDVDDRIRYIAQQLNLETIIWKFDSNDWAQADGTQSAAQVQQNYDSFMDKAKQGQFDQRGAIILTHELNNFTMQTAINNYPKLAAVFDHIVPVAVAQNKTQPYVEADYQFPSFAEYVSGTRQTNGTILTSASVSASKSSSQTGSASAPSSSSDPSVINKQNAQSGAVTNSVTLTPLASLVLAFGFFWL